jgi:hypothetical protein
MDDAPKFLGDDGPVPAAPVVEKAPVELTPEQLAAIEAVMAGRPVKPAACSQCKSADCAPVYFMLSHDQFEHDRRFRFKHGTEPVRQRYAPHVGMMCTKCYARAEAMRRLASRTRWGVIAGMVLACGYFVGALAHASTPLVLTLLFGGIGIAVVFGVVAVTASKTGEGLLPLPKMMLGGDLFIQVVSRDRGDIDAFLDKAKLVFLDPTELDRLVARARG